MSYATKRDPPSQLCHHMEMLFSAGSQCKIGPQNNNGKMTSMHFCSESTHESNSIIKVMDGTLSTVTANLDHVSGIML